MLIGLFQWSVRLSAEIETQMISLHRALAYSFLEPEEATLPVNKQTGQYSPLSLQNRSALLFTESNTLSLSQHPDSSSVDTSLFSNWPDIGIVEFRQISLRFRPDGPFALKNINLVVPPGYKIGIVGRTGAGKSSLVSLLFRLQEAEEGQVLVDGVNISQIPLSILRRRISIIPQDPTMFAGTILTNLDPTRSCPFEQIWNALDAMLSSI
ncbi:unnamed protein product [Protopolystoma xenopodis]|uniref:ABC transporter domain-containing protein n=1 Tax=Protopolystoma xenopodis TaxID=117903 RepID=A0A3S5FCL1_9PLAT|nr:unnamed protein product [Protopolystoma xenopodis]